MTQPPPAITPSTIAFIGGGNMARSLICGLIARGTPASTIRVAEPVRELREALARDYGVAVFDDNTVAVDGAAIWLLAAKPQVMRAICEALASQASARRPLVISIAAGITITQLARWLDGDNSGAAAPAIVRRAGPGYWACSARSRARRRRSCRRRASAQAAWS